MFPSTNQLVVAAKKLAIPGAIVGAFALGAAIFVGHGACTQRRQWTKIA